MPPVMTPEAISSSQSLSGLFPRGLRHEHLRGRAIGRPHHLEVAAGPLADGAGELHLRALEAQRAEDRGMLARRDVLADRLAVDADLLDGRLEDLQAGPAVGARPAVGLLLELLHVRLEVGAGGRARLHAPRADARPPVGVGAHHVLVEREGGTDRGEKYSRVEADFLGLLAG